MILNIRLISRTLLKGKTYTALNILGLAIGFACTLGIAGWIRNELSYDKHLPDSDRIYRLTFETNTSGNRLHFARCFESWISQMPPTFPQIEQLVRLAPHRHTAIIAGENKFYSDRIFATDTNFFKVFNITLLSGNTDDALKEPNTAVISSSIASKCFGNIDPVGQTIRIAGEYDEKMTLITVKGVMQDSPVNSHIHFDILTSFTKPNEAPGWAYIYLLLKKGTKPEQLISELPEFIKSHENISEQRTFTPYLQKITDIHLYSNKDREVEPNGNITVIYLFVIIAIVLLVVSFVNFYNLNKAKILSLQKSIYLQKIFGSDSKGLIFNSFIESLVTVLLAFGLAAIFIDLLQMLATSFPGLNLQSEGIRELVRIWPIALIIILTALITGSLPLIVHIFNVKIRGITINPMPAQGRGKVSSYSILMTIQFCLSIILMFSTITIAQQKKFMFSRSLGKMNPNILVFKRQNWEVRRKYQAIREKALENPLIKNFTASMEEPGGETLDALPVESQALDESHKDKSLFVLSVEDNFLNFFDLRLIAGRNFSKYNPARKGEDYVLNETAVKDLGWTPQEAIGRPFNIRFDTPGIFFGGTVVGVVKDFNITTIKQKVKSYVLFQKPIFYLCYLVEIDSVRRQEAILSLKNIWEQELPDYPFQYELIGDLYNSVYQKELIQAQLTLYLSILTIVIICMGIFSITSVLVERRTREIGIRKVNGARVADLLSMLNSDFIRWFIIAFIVACPAAWYAMHKWLQNFTYKTGLHWWVFLASGIIILAISVITVTIQSWRVTTKNPVEALRYE
jgi:putative ABC transport system permease protein